MKCFFYLVYYIGGWLQIIIYNQILLRILVLYITQDLIRRMRKHSLGHDLGSSFGGISGTATVPGKMKIFGTIRHIIQSLGFKSYEFIDIGAGDGVMVSLALCYGAKYSVGMEVKWTQESVFQRTFIPLIESNEGKDCVKRVSIAYGKDVVTYSSLPTLQSVNESEPRVAFAFCDGFEEEDRRYIFETLIRKDSLVRVLICSGGRGKGDRYRKPDDILNALNGGEMKGCGLFSFHSVIKVAMSGSSFRKTLFVFTRI